MLLQEPRLVGVSEGSPEWFQIQREIIRTRPLMKLTYDGWYRALLRDLDRVPDQQGLLVELGSGGSYLQDLCPGLITSDVVAGSCDQVIDARSLPFDDGTVRALFLTHAFHHIPDVKLFLTEAQRVLTPGGVVAMIEVSHTPFARLIFDRFHPEAYDDSMESWAFEQHDSMMDANQALSWNVFVRDRPLLERIVPDLKLLEPEFLPWLSYLLSGGVTRRNLVPTFLTPLFVAADAVSRPLDRLMALHWHLTLQKRG